jgi:hypothetical protein
MAERVNARIVEPIFSPGQIPHGSTPLDRVMSILLLDKHVYVTVSRQLYVWTCA